MRCTVAALLSAATFSLGAFARPPPTDPAASSTHLAKRYAPGWCGVHVVQYQKNEGPSDSGTGNSEYRLDVTLNDALQDDVGGVPLLSAAGGVFNGIDSQLPYVFEVEVGGVDSEPVLFQYNGQAWSSDDQPQCGSTGDYSGGSRSFNCGFNC